MEEKDITVIYSDFNDPDTKALKKIWQGLAGVTLVTNGTEEKIRKALTEEKDTLLFCGHGTATGLWMPHKNIRNPYFPFTYAFSEKDVPLIKAENIPSYVQRMHDRKRHTLHIKGMYSREKAKTPTHE